MMTFAARRTRTGIAALTLLAALAASAAFALTPSADPQKTATGAAAPPAPVTWPMPVETFLAGDFLERSDIVLTKRNWDITSYLIRAATDSPFSHAALVFAKANQEPGITQNFVIEAGTGGVDITNIRDYLNTKGTFVAIKRFPRPWFDIVMKARVRGVLLDKIKGSYDYWAIGRIARSLWFGVQNSMQRDTGTTTRREKTLEKYADRNWTPPNDFICSGLVQIGFVETVVEYVKSGALPASTLNEVVFQEATEKWLPDATGWRQIGKDSTMVAEFFLRQNATALQSVTPDDLASSEKLDWKYLIVDGMVHQVKTYNQVRKMID